MELTQTSWKKAFALAGLALYGPFLLLGIFGFPGDPTCRGIWWKFMPILPGAAPSEVFLSFPQIEIAGMPLRRMQPDWVAEGWRHLTAPLQAAPRSVRLLIAGTFVCLFLMLLALMFRRCPQRGSVRGAIFAGGLVVAGGCAALTYAMFLA